MTEAETSSTENMIEGAGMQIALPREYRMIPRPGQVPKQSIAQQIAEFNQVPKAYPITFDMAGINPEEEIEQENESQQQSTTNQATLEDHFPVANQFEFEGQINPYNDLVDEEPKQER